MIKNSPQMGHLLARLAPWAKVVVEVWAGLWPGRLTVDEERRCCGASP